MCRTCADYLICSDCADGCIYTGRGPKEIRIYIPPFNTERAPLQINTPDGQVVEIQMPREKPPGAAVVVRYGESPNPSAETPMVRIVKKMRPVILGHRWFAVLACGLVQIIIAPTGYLPWLPPNTVLITSQSAWLLWIVLAGFVASSSLLVDHKELTCCRFVSAAVQGYIVGHVIAFNLSTLLARAAFAVMLGAANALDRVASTARCVANTPVAPAMGVQGFFEADGTAHRIELSQVLAKEVLIMYCDRPASRPATEKVHLGDPRLVLTLPPKKELDKLKTEELHGFQMRPWGFACGVTLSQWVLTGFGQGDAFVSGMLTQQALMIASLPVTAALLWYCANSSDDWCIWCLCALVFLGLCVFEVIAFLPFLVGITAFAVTQLMAHQVIVFIAIPVDTLVFLTLWKPSARSLALWGLGRIAGNAGRLAPPAAKQAGGRLLLPTAEPLLNSRERKRAGR